ncbi:hypothetical protein [Victivallis sp.]|uniref:hypothetical protein n=1 Tax=Victivallis sp. TaxID=2049020 RepID=UPI003A95073F
MKKMCKKLFCAGIFALTSALPAATPIENDFSVNAATKGMTLGKNAAIADGVLDLKGWPVARWDLSSFRGPVRIQFRLSPQQALHEKNFHYGFNLVAEDGRNALFYAARNRIDAQLTSPKTEGGKVLSKAWINPKMETGIQDRKWSQFDITVTEQEVQVRIDGALCMTARFALLPLKEFNFHSYNYHLQVDDLKIEAVGDGQK